MYWDELTSPQLDALDRAIPVLLPISATEQHGYHLPMATDRMIGNHICEQINKVINEQVLVLPMISIGCSEHHKDFPGSLSVQHDTMLSQMSDIADCVVSYGFKNLFVINSHGGNQGIAQSFLERFGYRNPEVTMAFSSWWRVANEEIRSIQESGPGGVGHAGEFETSLMLHIAPHLVDMNQALENANIPTFTWAENDLVNGSKVSLYRRFSEVTPNGVIGDPLLGTAEKGKMLIDIIVKEYVSILKEFRAGPPANS